MESRYWCVPSSSVRVSLVRYDVRQKSRHPQREPLPFSLSFLNKPLNVSDSSPRPVQVQGSSLVLLARLKVAMGLNLPRRA